MTCAFDISPKNNTQFTLSLAKSHEPAYKMSAIVYITTIIHITSKIGYFNEIIGKQMLFSGA